MTDQLRQAIAAIKNGDKANGKRYLTEILASDPNNEKAWLWMTQVSSSNHDRIYCLQKVLEINPDNEQAKQGLAVLQKNQANQRQQSEPPQEPKTMSPTPTLIKPVKKLKPIDSNQATKKCPYCAERIKAEAIVCRYCGKELAVAQTGQSVQPSLPQTQSQQTRNGLAIFSLLLSLSALPFYCYGPWPCWGVLGIGAIITGSVALKQINKSEGRQKGEKMAKFSMAIILASVILQVVIFLFLLLSVGTGLNETFENIIQDLSTPTP